MTGTNTTATMTISAGRGTDQSLVAPLLWTSFSWAITNGNAANGCSAGTTLANSTTYHMYVCWGSSGYCSYASTAFSMVTSSAPSGYQSYVRRLFSFVTSAAGALLPGTANEVWGGAYEFVYTTAISDQAGSAPTSATLISVSVPSGLKMQWLGRVAIRSITTTVNYGQIWSPDEPTQVVSNTGAALAAEGTTATAQSQGQMPSMLLTNTSAQLYLLALAAADMYVITAGYVDFRRS
jgi:hypothetical protein